MEKALKSVLECCEFVTSETIRKLEENPENETKLLSEYTDFLENAIVLLKSKNSKK